MKKVIIKLVSPRFGTYYVYRLNMNKITKDISKAQLFERAIAEKKLDSVVKNNLFFTATIEETN